MLLLLVISASKLFVKQFKLAASQEVAESESDFDKVLTSSRISISTASHERFRKLAELGEQQQVQVFFGLLRDRENVGERPAALVNHFSHNLVTDICFAAFLLSSVADLPEAVTERNFPPLLCEDCLFLSSLLN